MALLQNGEYTHTFSSSIENLETVEKITSTIAEELNFHNSAMDDLSIAITELFNNAIHHGNKNDPHKKIKVRYLVSSSQLKISVKDQGGGFSPDEIKDPLAPENILAENGRGLYLVKNLMDNVEVKVHKDGCEIIITKQLLS